VVTDQWILRLLKVRIILNGKDIYELQKNRPSVIEIFEPSCILTLTDGFHHSKRFQVNFKTKYVYRLKVSSILDNGRLIFLLLLTLFFFAMAILNELFWLKLVSFIPLILILYFYYIKRDSFFLLEAY
jgi:hypothetical protein